MADERDEMLTAQSTALSPAAASRSREVMPAGTKCAMCKGTGVIDDDPEVIGSVSECPMCVGFGFLTSVTAEANPSPAERHVVVPVALLDRAKYILANNAADGDELAAKIFTALTALSAAPPVQMEAVAWLVGGENDGRAPL